MIHLVAGDLLEKASGAVPTSSLPATADEVALIQRRRAAALMRRLGRIWPDLFVSLDHQNQLLAAAARRARGAWAQHAGEPFPGPPVEELLEEERRDPLALHAHLLRQIDRLVMALRDLGPLEWAQAARRRLRRDLGSVAAVEAALLDSGPGT
jgi:hypothetical protein